MSDKPIHQAPPPLRKLPAEDTARYVAWMAKRGTPIGAQNPDDKAHEDVSLRILDWGFFDHGVRPGDVHDRAALDRSDHAVVASEKTDKGDWYALLSTKGFDPAIALARAAWLFRAGTLEPSPSAPQVTPPTLTKASDGTITLQGWVVYPPAGRATRLTVIATPKSVKLLNE